MTITRQQIEKKAEQLVKQDVFYNATWLITDLIKAHYEGVQVESIDIDELESQLYDPEEDEYREVYQWWAISEYLGDVLKELGDYILAPTHIGYIWGRTGCGYELYEDFTEAAEHIMKRFNKQMEQYNK